MSRVFIYALTDPRTGEVRYVGWTKDVRRRLREHIYRSLGGEKTHKARWIRILISQQKRPGILVLEEVQQNLYAEREKYWIAHFGGVEKLTNHTIGGDGVIGYHHTPERIEKYASKLRGVPKSHEHRRRLAESHIGMKASEETKEKMRKAHLGRKNPLSAIEKTAAAHRGMKRSELTRRKLRECWMVRRRKLQVRQGDRT